MRGMFLSAHEGASHWNLWNHDNCCRWPCRNSRRHDHRCERSGTVRFRNTDARGG